MARVPQTIALQGARTVAAPIVVTTTPLALEQTADPAINNLQRNLAVATAPAALPFSDGNLFRDIAFVANVAKTLNHRLGAKPRFAIMNTSAFARFKRVALSDTALDPKMISIVADATCVADVWVYK